MGKDLPITITHYGLNFYADELEANRPYAFVRYGCGEWARIVPDLPEWRTRTGPCPQVPTPLWTIWSHEWAPPVLRAGFVNAPRHPRYWLAIWQLDGLRRKGYLDYVMDFIVESKQADRPWHSGSVWQQAAKGRSLKRFVDVLRSHPLPLMLIGPDYLEPLTHLLPIHTHIPTHDALSPIRDLPFLREQVVHTPRPAVYMFSASGIGKTIISQLFPLLGEDSFMIDFGAVWDGYCGFRSRGYHEGIREAQVLETFGEVRYG